MLQTSAIPTRRINASSCFYYAVLPSFAGCPFILVRRPYLIRVCEHRRVAVSVWAVAWVMYVQVLVCLLVQDLQSLSQSGLNHLSGHELSRATSRLSYQSIDMAPALPFHVRRPMHRLVSAPPRRNTNWDADGFCFGHLSRHWSPCGLLRWWQMDCHLWTRWDWDLSLQVSLSDSDSKQLLYLNAFLLLYILFPSALTSQLWLFPFQSFFFREPKSWPKKSLQVASHQLMNTSAIDAPKVAYNWSF